MPLQACLLLSLFTVATYSFPSSPSYSRSNLLSTKPPLLIPSHPPTFPSKHVALGGVGFERRTCDGEKLRRYVLKNKSREFHLSERNQILRSCLRHCNLPTSTSPASWAAMLWSLGAIGLTCRDEVKYSSFTSPHLACRRHLMSYYRRCSSSVRSV